VKQGLFNESMQPGAGKVAIAITMTSEKWGGSQQIKAGQTPNVTKGIQVRILFWRGNFDAHYDA